MKALLAMRSRMVLGVPLCASFAACAPPPIAMNVTCGAPPSADARQSVPSLVIQGSALESLDDGELARRAIQTSTSLRGLAGIGKRDEAAARDGVHLTYAKTPPEVRTYILGQYRFVRVKVLDEARELTRRLGDKVEGSDAVFTDPADPDAIEDAADALEALSRRLVVDP